MLIKSTPPRDRSLVIARYNLSSEVTDEMISSKLAAQNVGYPLLDTPDRKTRWMRRWSGCRTSLRTMREPSTTRWHPSVSRNGRRNLHLLAHTVCVGAWDWGVAFEPMKLGARILQMTAGSLQGKAPTPKRLAGFESAALMSTLLIGSFAALRGSGNIIGGGPLNGEKRAAWRAALKEKGQANSIGIPWAACRS